MGNYGVYQRDGSPFYWIYYYDEAGERVQESSKKRLSDPLGRKQAYDLAKMKGEGVARPATGSIARFDRWVEDWIRSRLPNAKQAKSLNAYLRQWSFINAFLVSQKIFVPAGVTYNVAIQYFEWRKANKRFPGRPRIQTAAAEIQLFKRVMREAVRRGFIPKSPIEDIDIVTPDYKEKPEITPEEEATIRQELVRREGKLPLKERWMTISFEIAIRHGWRIAECSFPINRIDFKKWTVLVHQKGDRWRTVPVHTELRPLFSQLKEAGAKMSCVFPENNVQRASYQWSLLLHGCERDGVMGILPHLCFHCCRVTVISRMCRAGLPERLVMEWVGHASTAVHRIYQRVRSDDLERCIAPSSTSTALLPNPSPQT